MSPHLIGLIWVYRFKIAATITFWCLPLLLFPKQLLEVIGFPEQPTYMFVRMLGWAYLALCVGYYMGLKAAINGERILAPKYVGIYSNGGGRLNLLYYGISGTWSDWGIGVQFVAWSSVVATFFITLGLYLFGLRNLR